MKDFIKINDKDNIVIALRDFKMGEHINVDGREVSIKDIIPKGHKIALESLEQGSRIIKYGATIGYAKELIDMGSHVHSHNMKTSLEGVLEYSYDKRVVDKDNTKDRGLTFKGYKRKNGDIGIRNELWIVPTVGCVNGIGEMILKEFKATINSEDIDGMEVFKHNYGCSQLGDDHQNTVKILGDIVKHPNAGGVLVLGLGCENNTMDQFIKSLGDYDKDRVKFLVAQDVDDELEEGIKILSQLFNNMKKDIREEISISELKIGLKCGGSDGFSGITANPLLGAFSDFLISQGGTTVLTEVPEMFGAETFLMERAKNEEVFNDTVALINDFKNYFIRHEQPVYENPSPGNKEGGITTLEEKSLGCIQKGGSAEIVDVLKYGEVLERKGLNLLESPGNDLVASTVLGASGCHMVLFTTGRGTPFGSFVPTMKIATNSELYNKKRRWIDFDAGVLLKNKSMDELLEEFIEYVIDVSNGKLVNNEKNDFREIAIFKTGVTL
ncbi:UxaA family hydrolase [Clostridiisalibacter paucivorans]|uniref:UxaA family hydrolase n=1 Tax=Clostridiisalibacter paucivorans TaxID=408753 RepID=UPI0004789A8D|nr:altronate dehydratase family protein [Clostridiisalibacter paucivorans]